MVSAKCQDVIIEDHASEEPRTPTGPSQETHNVATITSPKKPLPAASVILPHLVDRFHIVQPNVHCFYWTSASHLQLNVSFIYAGNSKTIEHLQKNEHWFTDLQDLQRQSANRK